MPAPVAGTISLPSRVNSAIRCPSGQPLAQSHARPCSCLLALQGSLRVLYSSLALYPNIRNLLFFIKQIKVEINYFPLRPRYSNELLFGNKSQCIVSNESFISQSLYVFKVKWKDLCTDEGKKKTETIESLTKRFRKLKKKRSF